jgi:hypothetical protein
VVHLLETNVSRSMLRALLHTMDVDVWVNRPDRQGWTDNHDECVWQRDSDKSYQIKHPTTINSHGLINKLH